MNLFILYVKKNTLFYWPFFKLRLMFCFNLKLSRIQHVFYFVNSMNLSYLKGVLIFRLNSFIAANTSFFNWKFV